MSISVKHLLFALAIGSGLAFLLFTNMVRKDIFLTQDPLAGIDFDLTVKLQNNVPVRLDPLLKLTTDIASVVVFSIILFGVLAFLYRKLSAVIILAFYFGGQALEYVLKNLLRQSGPPFQFQRIHTDVSFDKDYQIVGYSYPSGHSFRTTFFAIIITALVARKYGWTSPITLLVAVATFGFAFVVDVAKVVHGGHWTSDIIGGSVLAVCCACTALLFVSFPHKKRPHATDTA